MASQLRDIHEALMGTAYGQPGLVKRVEKVEAKAEKTGKLVEKFGYAWSFIVVLLTAGWNFVAEGVKHYLFNNNSTP